MLPKMQFPGTISAGQKTVIRAIERYTCKPRYIPEITITTTKNDNRKSQYILQTP